MPRSAMRRDLVLDGGPSGCAGAPTELQLRYLTELTRLVLKGHADHFASDNHDDGEAPVMKSLHTCGCMTLTMCHGAQALTVQRALPSVQSQGLHCDASCSYQSDAKLA